MSEIVPFGNDEFRLDITSDGDSFRVQAPGLARCLSVSDAHTLLRNIPADEKGSALVQTPSGEQRVLYVTEAGFYRAIGQRQLGRIADKKVRAQVERFQKWVYGVVLPGLRRGEVVQAVRPSSELDLIIAAAVEMKRMREEVEQARTAAIEAAQEATVANARLDAIEGRHDYYAALGWAKLREFTPTDDRTLAALGRVASTVGKQSGVLPGRAPHAHYGEVNTWPLEVWDEAARRMRGAA